ncbi:hypothetical protein CDAR_382431 [Caerostris darwini]|uniref:Uncharacterized protein n=1 Tax=Caerostris darwini TaxID=1538125 RepID=A0AAV4VXL0_9ARAC|nr:hypothetical protein CDAR_382431 [Caerostris darwini]
MLVIEGVELIYGYGLSLTEQSYNLFRAFPIQHYGVIPTNVIIPAMRMPNRTFRAAYESSAPGDCSSFPRTIGHVSQNGIIICSQQFPEGTTQLPAEQSERGVIDWGIGRRSSDWNSGGFEVKTLEFGESF